MRFGLLLEFMNDETLRHAAAVHLGLKDHQVKTNLLVSSLLKGQASGGGWHKDAPMRGIKALIYLDNVTLENGPFAMLLGYNDSSLVHNSDGRKTRYDDWTIEEQVRRGAQVRPLPGLRGSVIMFETSSVRHQLWQTHDPASPFEFSAGRGAFACLLRRGCKLHAFAA